MSMKYKAGDVIAVCRDGKIEEDEIAWVRHKPGPTYYHTVNDDYYGDEHVVGVVRDGKREPNDLYIRACEAELAHASEKMRSALAWPDAVE
jgi:hypothetical protein